jgi:hypothetical protein
MGIGDLESFGTKDQVNLTEGYQDRVNQIVQRVVQHSNTTQIRPDDVVRLIDTFARAAQIPDWLAGGKAQKDFVKDVTVALKGNIRWAVSPKGKQAAQKALNTLSVWMAQDMESELGNIFPDGDPHDALDTVIRSVIRSDRHHSESWAKRYLGDPELTLDWLKDTILGAHNYQHMEDFMWHHVAPLVHKAFATEHGQDVHAYLADMWDSWRADARHDARMRGKSALDQFDQQHSRNPYR